MKRGFGSITCDGCGKQMSRDLEYYSVVKKTLSGNRCRTQKSIAVYCTKCAEFKISMRELNQEEIDCMKANKCLREREQTK